MPEFLKSKKVTARKAHYWRTWTTEGKGVRLIANVEIGRQS